MEGLRLETWPDNAKYEEKERNLSPRAGIASSGIPDTGGIILDLNKSMEWKFIWTINNINDN